MIRILTNFMRLKIGQEHSCWISAAVSPRPRKNRITLRTSIYAYFTVGHQVSSIQPRVHNLTSLFFSVTTEIYFTFPHRNFSTELPLVGAEIYLSDVNIKCEIL